MTDTTKTAKHWFSETEVSVEQYFFFSSLALIVIFAWMEPTGAAGIGFAKGLVFWTIQTSILIPLLIAIQHLVSHYLTLKAAQSPWIQTAVSGVVTALLFVPIGYFLDTLFAIPGNESEFGIVYGLLDEAGGLVVPVTVTWLALNAPWILQLDFSKKAVEIAKQVPDLHEITSPIQTEQPTRFLQELRSRNSGEIISISSELHYVRVVTTDSEVMFLYNLRDAIEELSADSGLQIHRSHWVARAHLKKIIKKNGSSECVLSNGKRLPVSRRKFAEVRDLLDSEISE